jgi:hypothetical protein
MDGLAAGQRRCPSNVCDLAGLGVGGEGAVFGGARSGGQAGFRDALAEVASGGDLAKDF